MDAKYVIVAGACIYWAMPKKSDTNSEAMIAKAP